MKKLALALVCLVSVAFFASCQKTVEHPEPTIAVMTGENFITGTVDNPTIINANDENALSLQYGFHMESNAETQKELKNMVLTIDVITYGEDGQENDVYYDTIDLTGKTSYDFSEYLFEERETITLMEGTIKAVVTDVDDKASAATIAFEIQMDYVPVPLISYSIEWVRRGANLIGSTEQEMATLGLKWENTYKAPFATIKPLDNATMYVCNGDDFDGIEYVDDKYTYFSNLAENATPVEYYRNIDANQDSNYNDMLAVVYGDQYYLVHITHADIETGSYGTQITITGEVK